MFQEQALDHFAIVGLGVHSFNREHPSTMEQSVEVQDVPSCVPLTSECGPLARRDDVPAVVAVRMQAKLSCSAGERSALRVKSVGFGQKRGKAKDERVHRITPLSSA